MVRAAGDKNNAKPVKNSTLQECQHKEIEYIEQSRTMIKNMIRDNETVGSCRQLWRWQKKLEWVELMID